MPRLPHHRASFRLETCTNANADQARALRGRAPQWFARLFGVSPSLRLNSSKWPDVPLSSLTHPRVSKGGRPKIRKHIGRHAGRWHKHHLLVPCWGPPRAHLKPCVAFYEKQISMLSFQLPFKPKQRSAARAITTRNRGWQETLDHLKLTTSSTADANRASTRSQLHLPYPANVAVRLLRYLIPPRRRKT